MFYKGRNSIHDKLWIHGVGYSYNPLYHTHIIPFKDLSTDLGRSSKQIWNESFGYIGMKHLEIMLLEDQVYGISSSHKFLCEGFIKGKLYETPFRNSEFQASNLLKLVHSDVCDMIKYSVGYNWYFTAFTDEKSRFVHRLFIK